MGTNEDDTQGTRGDVMEQLGWKHDECLFQHVC